MYKLNFFIEVQNYQKRISIIYLECLNIRRHKTGGIILPEITLEELGDIHEKIEAILNSEMEVEDFTGDTVPSINDLDDENRGLILTDCSILFVDIRSSTQLSDRSQAKSMAKIYRAFVRAMAMSIYSCGGKVRQIAGDRVMGVFLSDAQESSASKAIHAGRAIITAVEHVFNPLCKRNINNKTIQCGVGIDLGRVLTTSVGMEHEGEDARDLVWAGKIANVSSKHTDLAEAGEIFVTKRFYDKLPTGFKKNTEGINIWKNNFRIKGNSIYEGYGVLNYYADCISEEEQSQFSSGDEVAENFQAESENNLSGINESQIITTIVNGVRRQTQDLLDRFESVIRREHNLDEKETTISKKEQTLLQREREVIRIESELKKKEEQIEFHKNKTIYELKMEFFRNNMDSYSLEDFFSSRGELQKLGIKIEKDSIAINKDLYYWKLVRYFENKEPLLAYKLIIERLTIEHYNYSMPWESSIINIVKQLGKQQEYFNAVRHHFDNCNPSLETTIHLNKTLKELGLKTQNLRYLT